MKQLLCEERLNCLGFFHFAKRILNGELWSGPIHSAQNIIFHYTINRQYTKILNRTELNFGIQEVGEAKSMNRFCNHYQWLLE